MLHLAVVLAVLTCITTQEESGLTLSNQSHVLQSLELREAAIELHEKALKMQGDAYDMINSALQIKEESLKMRETAFEVRMESETRIVEALELVKAQVATTNIRLEEMKLSLDNATERQFEMDSKFEKLSGKLVEKVDMLNHGLEERLGSLEGAMNISVETIESIKQSVESSEAEELMARVQTEVQTLDQDLKERLGILEGAMNISMENIRLEEMKLSLDNATERQFEMDSKFEELSGKLVEKVDMMNHYLEERLSTFEGAMNISMKNTETIKESVESNEDLMTRVKTEVQTIGEMTGNIKTRQEVMLSEVRLISLYKMSDQTSDHILGGGGHGSDLAVDGQFAFSHWEPNGHIRAFTHNEIGSNEKIWIHLGALFRIYRIKIWNARHCCTARFIGTKIYADEKLIGVAQGDKKIYDFKVADNDPTYAKTVTLHQERREWLHVVEVQVWGTGPYSEDDKFA